MRDTIYRDEAIEAVAEDLASVLNVSKDETRELAEHALSALPSAEAVKVAYICDGRKCDSDCSECFRTTDIEHAKDFELVGDTYFQQPSAETKPTIIRSKALIPAKDFKEWAKRIRETNPNAVVIPCDAEVVSSEAVQVVRCKDCKWYGTTDCQIQESFYGIKDFDFCSYGERKGGDDE